MEKHIIQTRLNAIQIIAMQHTDISKYVLQRLVYSQERCTIFKDRIIYCSCLCICCATIRLLLTVCHATLQRFTIIARLIGFSVHALPLVYTGLLSHRDIFAFMDGCTCLELTLTMLWQTEVI